MSIVVSSQNFNEMMCCRTELSMDLLLDDSELTKYFDSEITIPCRSTFNSVENIFLSIKFSFIASLKAMICAACVDLAVLRNL